MYRNLGGWRFEDITGVAGLELAGEDARGAVLVDVNGDRRLDLLVSTQVRGVRVFFNEGGRFREGTEEAGTGGWSGSTTLALADVDGNGTLDLYITRYRADDIRDSSLVEVRRVGGRTELHPRYAGRLMLGAGGLIEFGEPDVLMLNDGRGRFSPVSWTEGRFLDENGRAVGEAPRDWGLTAAFRDLNGDLLPDLYVCNDYWTPDRVWLNAGGGVYRMAGAAVVRHTSENSMGVDFADLDRDGLVDFLVLDMLDPDPRVRRRQALAQAPVATEPGEVRNRPQVMRNTLFRGRKDGTFAEVAEFAGLGRSGWSWQPLFLDVDLDGFEDVLISTGHRRDVQDLDATERIRKLQHPWSAMRDRRARQEAFSREKLEHGRLYPGLETPVRAYRNRGGFRFEESTGAWGLEEAGVNQGMALADLDGDGDLDVVVNRLNRVAAVWENTGGGSRVGVRLRGRPPNTAGVGARVRWVGPGVPVQTQEVMAGGRYLSGSEMLLVFAGGVAGGKGTVEVTWLGGRVSTVREVEVDGVYEIDEAGAVAPVPKVGGTVSTLFEDWSGRLGHVHREQAPLDFAEQPLLHRARSMDGPGVLIADLNQDDWPDLVIGSGAGGSPGVYTNDAAGGLVSAAPAGAPGPVGADMSGMLADRDASGRVRVLAGLAGGGGGEGTLLSWSAFGGGAWEPVGELREAVGPLAMGDPDGDGVLELFVGGGFVPGRYPESTGSRVYRREGGGWRLDPERTAAVGGLARVQSAVWGDLDGDGDSDLVVACEWSPLRVYRSDGGRLVEVTREWGFGESGGWWQGVTLGDVDGDGWLDVVAGNWGWNSEYRATASMPAVLVHGDFLGRGVVDLVEGEWDPVRGVLAPRRRLDEFDAVWPTLRNRFPTHGEFVRASLESVLEGVRDGWGWLEARTLASTVFLRRPGRFEAVPLPAEAQYSPVFGVVVADFDGDGREDLFLGQNDSSVRWPLPRQDAGRGLLLRGDGEGGWAVMDGSESGIQVDGAQRGVAVGDFDRDGRLDLVVGQNGGETRWLRNRGGSRGLRVRLEGGVGNPDGIGAVVWVETAGGAGPVRPVLGGSGWWSQSGTELVLARPVGGVVVVVRWTDGTVGRVKVAEKAPEVVIRKAGRSAGR